MNKYLKRTLLIVAVVSLFAYAIYRSLPLMIGMVSNPITIIGFIVLLVLIVFLGIRLLKMIW